MSATSWGGCPRDAIRGGKRSPGSFHLTGLEHSSKSRVLGSEFHFQTMCSFVLLFIVGVGTSWRSKLRSMFNSRDLIRYMDHMPGDCLEVFSIHQKAKMGCAGSLPDWGKRRVGQKPPPCLGHCVSQSPSFPLASPLVCPHIVHHVSLRVSHTSV